ncbi:unnamed protein product [Schistocephalus solidus]|uniref:Uncharacterized protein n=1 Tax=Schistocephalus solidus TaxID=70667 RepID=A0A0X3NK27_SCHSO|nr:unnamed protein product [Schistocephalus solidus]
MVCGTLCDISYLIVAALCLIGSSLLPRWSCGALFNSCQQTHGRNALFIGLCFLVSGCLLVIPIVVHLLRSIFGKGAQLSNFMNTFLITASAVLAFVGLALYVFASQIELSLVMAAIGTTLAIASSWSTGNACLGLT